MEIIVQVIETSLEELFQKGVIDDYQEMDAFEAECSIEYDLSRNGVTVVTLCNWLIFVWWMYYADGTRKLEAYHAQSIAAGKCQGCSVSWPESELRDFHGRKLCETCRWIGLPQRST